MMPRIQLPHCLRRWAAQEHGAVTVEFAVAVPALLFIFVMSIDLGVAQLRQAFLDRGVDMAVREVRLGTVPSDGSVRMAELICANTAFLPDCLESIAVEMQPIDTANFDGLEDPFRCRDLEQEISPALAFNPGAGGVAQELMMIRACILARPFISLTGYVSALPRNTDGNHVLVSRNVFVNEPRSSNAEGS